MTFSRPGTYVHLMVERTQAAAPKAEPPLSGFFTAGDIELDWRKRQVRVGKKSVHLTPKEAELFWHLLSKRGRVVSHRELLRAVWGDARVDRLNYLHVFITNLRKKIESNPAHPRHILTVPWVGYSFSAPDELEDGL